MLQEEEKKNDGHGVFKPYTKHELKKIRERNAKEFQKFQVENEKAQQAVDEVYMSL